MTQSDRAGVAVAAASATDVAPTGSGAADAAELRPSAGEARPAPAWDAVKERITGRLWLRDLLAVGVLAVVLRAVFQHASPGQDQTFALIWGRDMVHGRTPDLTFPSASTAHPLSNVIAAIATLFGKNGAVDALIVVSYVSLGAVLWGTYCIGEAAFSRLWGEGMRARLAAAFALLLVGSSFGVIAAGVSVYLDAPYLALVVWATVLEVRKPRRGTSVVVLLTLAALFRPEAAVLAACYWIYACRRSERRWVTAAIVLIAPVGWVLMALTATGDPWYTVGAQRLGGASNPHPTHFGAGRQFSAMMSALRLAIRGDALLGAAVGVLLALRLRATALVVPGVTAVLVLLTYGAFVVLGLAVPDRMLLTPAVMLTLFCAFAVFGWVGCRSVVERRAWGAVGIAVVALLLATAPSAISGLSRLDGRASGQQQAISDVNALGSSPTTGAVLRTCRPVSVGVPSLVPFAAYYLDRSLRDVGIAQVQTPTHGTFIAPTSTSAAELLVGHTSAQRATTVPLGFTRVAGNRSWNVYTRGC